jgi:Zn-dependent protease with chaperone function
MAMNFYEHQDQARRKTGRLIIFFSLAILLIVVALYATGMVLLNWSMASESEQGTALSITWWNYKVLLGVLGFTILVVGGGCLVRIRQLSSGGSVVAESLGGSLLDHSGASPDERRLLNVVEEMAIASGVPVPPVYLIDDETINAFAAGYKSTDAVIGVTRGSIEHLSREQLQGVIAHEYSHIFNGDMRLNIRLIGVIYGLLVMGMIGLQLVRIMAWSGMMRRSSSKKDGGGALIAIMIIGLILAALGFIGTFFGRLIQASVSRQREYLADSSAVQYTRNPGGISGALRAIAGLDAKTAMPPLATEYNHMFFSQAMKSVFATHPPLSERISRIEQVDVERVETDADSTSEPVAFAGFASHVSTASLANAVQVVGAPDAAGVASAGALLGSIPPGIVEATHDTWTARLLILALLLDEDSGELNRQLSLIKVSLDDGHLDAIRSFHASIARMHHVQQLPLIDMCMPSLSRMSREQYELYMQSVEKLIKSDGKISLFEWTVHTVLKKHLGERYDPEVRRRGRPRRLKSRMEFAAMVLATVSCTGSEDAGERRDAYKAGMVVIGGTDPMPDASECTLRTLRHTLQKLKDIGFKDRKILLDACLASIDHDGQTTVDESLLLRGIADSLECPMPPVMS